MVAPTLGNSKGGDHVDRLMAACAAGDVRACAELLDAYRSLDLRSGERDRVLDTLATSASTSPAALDLLVRVVYEERFVRSEIRKVLINDTSGAEEALQETALAMVRALPSFRAESTFRTWVSSIGRNQAVAVLRRRAPTVKVTSFDEQLDPTTAGGAGLSEVARYSSLLADRADLATAIGQLPDDFGAVIRLRDVEQRSYQEIADALGIKLNTVRSRLARGRAQLAVMLEDGR